MPGQTNTKKTHTHLFQANIVSKAIALRQRLAAKIHTRFGSVVHKQRREGPKGVSGVCVWVCCALCTANAHTVWRTHNAHHTRAHPFAPTRVNPGILSHPHRVHSRRASRISPPHVVADTQTHTHSFWGVSTYPTTGRAGGAWVFQHSYAS